MFKIISKKNWMKYLTMGAILVGLVKLDKAMIAEFLKTNDVRTVDFAEFFNVHPNTICRWLK